jgi:AcrR family transcriptional regulator
VTNSRSALVEAAVEIFTERGYEAATVVDIAERAGVTTGALYSHFHGKLDLLLASLGLKSIEDFAREALAAGGAPGRAASAALATHFAQRPSAQAVLLLDVIVAARRDPELASTLRRLLANKVREFVNGLGAQIQAGAMSPSIDAEDLARFFTMAAFGNMVLAAVDEDPPSERAFSCVLDELLPAGSGGGRLEVLAEVGQAASASRQARLRMETAVRAAGEAGHSLRQTAEAAGVSHEMVRRIMSRRQSVGGDQPHPG